MGGIVWQRSMVVCRKDKTRTARLLNEYESRAGQTRHARLTGVVLVVVAAKLVVVEVSNRMPRAGLKWSESRAAKL